MEIRVFLRSKLIGFRAQGVWGQKHDALIRLWGDSKPFC